jgi:uncharacterized protein (TIGR02453 family)
MAKPWFTPALFTFLEELKENNEREWFLENRSRYEADARDPLLAFIQAFAEPLEGVSRHMLADPRPNGGSMFRIFRDARFSRDKSPYKTNIGAQFRHALSSKDVHGPMIYLHLDPGGCFTGAGLWRPDPDTIKRVRERIATKPKEWQAVRAKGLDVQGERLVRVPQGYDPAHPLAEDLKLKDFYVMEALTRRQVCAGTFMETFTEACRSAAPLMKFLGKALDMPY